MATKTSIWTKIIAFLATTRFYNIVLISIAEYLTALFILSNKSFYDSFFNYELHLLVLASGFSLASGFIINYFYDQDKDKISHPFRTQLLNSLSIQQQLYQYITYNFIALSLAALVSGKAVLFFIVYQGLLWLYSHKISKIVFLNNWFYAILSVFPVFALYLYYKNFTPYLWLHAAFLITILYLMDILKDIITQISDTIYNYHTLPNTIGIIKTKGIFIILSIINIFLASSIIYAQAVGFMKYYFYLAIIIEIFLLIKFCTINQQQQYQQLYFLYKIILIIGVFSLILIHINPYQYLIQLPY